MGRYRSGPDSPWVEVADEGAGTQEGMPPDPPTAVGVVASAVRAAATFVASGGALVSDEVYRFRLAICGECEHYTGSRCKLCKCFTAAKLRLPHEKCPIGKWSSVPVTAVSTPPRSSGS